jgi:hypothetical protein
LQQSSSLIEAAEAVTACQIAASSQADPFGIAGIDNTDKEIKRHIQFVKAARKLSWSGS